MSFRVLIADSLAPEGPAAVSDVDALVGDNRKGISREDLLECIHDYDALVVRSRTQVDAELLAAAHRLKVVGRAGIGIDNIDLKTIFSRQWLVNQPSLHGCIGNARCSSSGLCT